MNREETLERLSSEISCVQKLLDTKYSEVIEISYQQKLREILKKMTFFQEKLKNNTFEISIVGLEKSGKSTFANAFMGMMFFRRKTHGAHTPQPASGLARRTMHRSISTPMHSSTRNFTES